jgi:hypothetical protein
MVLLITVPWLLLSLISCGPSGAKRLEKQAESFGFTPLQLSVDGFALGGFHRLASPLGNRLHVYLEGDGQPWEQGLFPALDPTTRSSVMLPLMAMDKASALYLGRPCYNGHASDLGCSNGLWTGARYGEQVISAMSKALQDYCRLYGFDQLVLIGHSGGGSLTILLSNRVPQTRGLITLAGNFDINAWTDYHGLTRLTESLNPATSASADINEWHFLGERDTNIPPALFLEALKKRKHSRVQVVPNVEHTKGWDLVWPDILLQLTNGI